MWSRTNAVFAALAGLLPAILAEFLALGLAGAGHGWVAPLFLGLILFLAYPATFAMLALGRRHRRVFVFLLLAGLVTDAALAFATLDEGMQYFHRVFAVDEIVPLAWILLWLGWQAAALVAALAARPTED